MAKTKTRYRIIGGQGEWFAWRVDADLLPHRPHGRTFDVEVKGGWISVDGCIGRTPGEALHRLQTFLRRRYRV